MIAAVADTHAILWYIYADPQLSARADAFMRLCTEPGNQVAVSSITLVELVYLVEKGRVRPTAYSDVAALLALTDFAFVEVPVNARIAAALSGVARKEIPDMPDRIIAATALSLDVPLVTRDRRIRASTIETIW